MPILRLLTRTRSLPTTQRITDLRLALPAALLLLLAGCGAPTLLDSGSLPKVTKTSDGRHGAPGGGWCSALNELQTSLSADVAGASGTQYELDNGDVVGATVFRLGGRYPDAAAMRVAIRQAADKCRAGLADGTYTSSTIKPLTGLPGSAFGYELESTASDPRRASAQAYADAPDGRFIVVGVEHSGEGEPSVSIARLLKEAEDRAGDVEVG